jgi:nitronate monooxygenase
MTLLPPLRIGKHIAPYPIIQGVMGIRISAANLASAVANTGGMGIISAVGLGLNSPYFKKRKLLEANRLALIDEIQKARQLSPQGILGINAMVAVRDYETLVRTAAESGINLIISGAGIPLKLPEYTADYPDVALVPIVSSVRAARIICRKWSKLYNRLPDAFVVENPNQAGGHLGAKSEQLGDPALNPEQIIPDLIDYLRTEMGADMPIIAAGGIWSRSDIDRVLALGAKGVQIGTRFITTDECDADRRYKEFHLQASPEDVIIAPSPVGMPGRVIRNSFAEKAIACAPDLEQRCIANCLESCKCRDRQETYCIIQALDKAARGDVENGLVFAGSNAGRAQKIMPVAELMQELVS